MSWPIGAGIFSLGLVLYKLLLFSRCLGLCLSSFSGSYFLCFVYFLNCCIVVRISALGCLDPEMTYYASSGT